MVDIDYDTRGISPIVIHDFVKNNNQNEVCETMKKIAILMVVAVLAIGMVMAAEPGQIDSVTSVDLGEYTSNAGQSINLQSGNVTDADLSARVSTFVWAGLVGDVGGDIVLGTGNGAGQILYNWSAQGAVVYASEAAAIDWTDGNIIPLAVGNIPPQVNTGAADDYTNTFTGNEAMTASAIYDTVALVPFATTWDNTTTAIWKTYSFEDDAADEPIWAGEVQTGGTSFNGSVVDYQMILPEDGRSNDVSLTQYFLWAELV
ncbi:hypothetical protein K9M74_00570 [Candidatus Woesearchaeota archaeon]|nr:hypothetical protein [Candidatus Woesearchaeota archaeon]